MTLVIFGKTKAAGSLEGLGDGEATPAPEKNLRMTLNPKFQSTITFYQTIKLNVI